MPYRAIGSKVVDFAKSKGYGVGKKKIKHARHSMLRIQRNMHGNGLRVAGGAMSLAVTVVIFEEIIYIFFFTVH